MKILCVTNLYPPYIIGGYEILAHTAMQALAERGHDVYVATGKGKLLPQDDHHFGVYDLDLDRKEQDILGPIEGRVARFKRLVFHDGNYRATRRLIKEIQPDIVSFWNLMFLSVSPMIAARHLGVPRVTHLTDRWLLYNTVDLSPVASPQSRLGHYSIEAVRRLILPLIYHLVKPENLIIPSRSLTRTYLDSGFKDEAFHLVPHGIKTQMFPQKEAYSSFQEPVKLLYAGQLWEGKGAKILVQALGQLRKAGLNNFHLNIYGHGVKDFLDDLNRIIEQENLTDLVELCGTVDYADLPGVYREHDILVFPSVWNEPFPLVSLEAMASGLPVISSTAGGTQEAVRHNFSGLVVPEGDSQALASAISHMAKEPELCGWLGRRGARLSRSEYDFNLMIDRAEALYQQIIADRGSKARVGVPALLKPQPVVKDHNTPGVNLIADLASAGTAGLSARQMLRALRFADLPFGHVPVSQAGARIDEATLYEGLPAGGHYPVNLMFADARDPGTFRQEVLRQLTRNGYTIACRYGELGEVPRRWRPNMVHIDETWTSSQFSRQHLATSGVGTVHVIPPVVEARVEPADRQRFGLPRDRIIFLSSFSALSSPGRVNPEGVIDAFEMAFGDKSAEDRPLLVLHVADLEAAPEFSASLQADLARVGGVLLAHDYTSADLNALLNCADVYISLHRAEEFGIRLAQSMLLGKPVIGTGYSGNMDFMTSKNSFPVDYRLRPITRADFRYHPGLFWRYQPGSQWAEPDVAQAAATMRRIVDNPSEAQARGKRAASDIREAYSVEAVAQAVQDRLLDISADGSLEVAAHRGGPLLDLHNVEAALHNWEDLRTRDVRHPINNHFLVRNIPPLRFLMRLLIRVRNLGKMWALQVQLFYELIESLRLHAHVLEVLSEEHARQLARNTELEQRPASLIDAPAASDNAVQDLKERETA